MLRWCESRAHQPLHAVIGSTTLITKRRDRGAGIVAARPLLPGGGSLAPDKPAPRTKQLYVRLMLTE